MKNKRLLFIFVATALLASNCLEGMKTGDTFFAKLNDLQYEIIKCCSRTKESVLDFCKNNRKLSYRIDFGGGTTTDDVNEVLKTCKSIVGLNLMNRCTVELEEIDWSSIEKLWYLNLTNLGVSEKVFKKIFSTHKEIKELELYSKLACRLKDMNLFALNDLDLRSISFHDLHLDEDYLNKMGLKFKNLERLAFDSGGSYPFCLMKVKWERFENLKVLELSGMKIPEESLLKIVKSCKKLTKLMLPNSLTLTEKTLEAWRNVK